MVKKLTYPAFVILFIALVVLPLAFAFASALFEEGTFTLEHYGNALSSNNLQLLLKSCWIAGSVALLSTVLGSTIGWIIAKTNIPLSGLFKLIFLVPVFVSPYYFAVAWKDFFTIAELNNLPETGMVIFVLSLCFFPIPMLFVSSALENINRHLEEAGLLVAGKSKIAFSILLPMIRPALLSGFILIFILTLSEISVVNYFLVKSFASEILVQFAAYYNHGAAIASSFVLLLICIGLLFFEGRYLSTAPFLSVGTRGNPVRKNKLGPLRLPAAVVLAALWGAVTLLPLGVLCKQALIPPPKFSQVKNKIIETEGGGEIGYYLKKAYGLLEPVIPETIVYAGLGALIICLLGFVFAWYAQRKNKRIMDYVLLLTFAVPGTVLGIGLIKFYNRPMLEPIYGSMLIILIAYIGKFTFFASKILNHSISKIPVSLEGAARLSGANSLQRFRQIVAPLVSSGFFAAFIIAFVFCLSEIATVIVVYPPGSTLLPIKIATSMHNTPAGLMSGMVFIALSVTLISLTILFTLYYFLQKRKTWSPA